MTGSFQLQYQDKVPLDLEEEVLSPIQDDMEKEVRFIGKGYVGSIELTEELCDHCSELHKFFIVTVFHSFQPNE